MFDFEFRCTQQLLIIPLDFNFKDRGYEPWAKIKHSADLHWALAFFFNHTTLC